MAELKIPERPKVWGQYSPQGPQCDPRDVEGFADECESLLRQQAAELDQVKRELRYREQTIVALQSRATGDVQVIREKVIRECAALAEKQASLSCGDNAYNDGWTRGARVIMGDILALRNAPPTPQPGSVQEESQ